jgi:integrase/recombinase XerC
MNNNIIELFRKELMHVSCLKDKTTRLYIDMVYAYADYAKQMLHVDLITSKTHHIHKWMYYLKTKKNSYNYLRNAKVSLNRFFSFLVKTGYRKKNPAENLPRVKIPKSTVNKPVPTNILVTLLKSFNRNKWMGMRNFTIVSILWALGLRVNELLSIKRRDFNLDYDPDHKTGTLLVHGKGGKERTLFVVDTLYDTIFHYLSLEKTPKRQGSLIFPGSKGKCIGRDRVRQMIQEAAGRLGIIHL